MTALAEVWGRGRRAAAVLRLRPHDVATEEGRARERYRRVALAAAASAVARATAIGGSLISVPLTLRYLGHERYGVWLTISSAVAMLSFADLGLNNGLMNAIATAHGRNDERAAREAVSSAVAMLTVIAVLIVVALAGAYATVDWAALFNVRSAAAAREVGPSVAVLVACFAVNLPLSAVQRVQMGYQDTFAASAWQVFGSVVGVAALLAAIAARVTLPTLVLALVGAPMVAAAASSGYVFGVQRPGIRPRPSAVSRPAVRRLAVSGGLFFVLQMAGAVAFQADNLVVARYLGAAAVPDYAVPMKLFSIVPMLVGLVLMPLWPAYGEAIARREVAWVRRTYQRTLVLNVVVTVPVAAALVAVGPNLIRLWVGPSIAPTPLLLWGFGAWAVLYSLTGSFAMLLNGANVIGFQLVSASLMAAANIGISIVLVRHIGVAGPVYGSLIAVSLFTLIPCLMYMPRLFGKWRGEQAGVAP